MRASREDVEDACSFAWVEFLRVQPDRERSWRGWLFRTAQRQAWSLNARHASTRGIVNIDELEVGTTVEPADPRDRTELALDFEAAMQELRKLPERLQAVVFLNSQSSKHEQVAEVLGVSRQRIAYQLQLAGVKLTEIAERRIEASRPVASPRAARLRELEDNPPEWLVDSIGRTPARTKSSSALILAWRRAALAVDDYQRLRGEGREPTAPAEVETRVHRARGTGAASARAVEP